MGFIRDRALMRNERFALKQSKIKAKVATTKIKANKSVALANTAKRQSMYRNLAAAVAAHSSAKVEAQKAKWNALSKIGNQVGPYYVDGDKSNPTTEESSGNSGNRTGYQE